MQLLKCDQYSNLYELCCELLCGIFFGIRTFDLSHFYQLLITLTHRGSTFLTSTSHLINNYTVFRHSVSTTVPDCIDVLGVAAILI